MRIVRKAEYTTVVCLDEPGAGNACHRYNIDKSSDNIPLCGFTFQNGPIQENLVNGVQNEDLLAIVIDRLKSFQSGNFACEENHEALMHTQMALDWLVIRTNKRKARGVEGKSIK